MMSLMSDWRREVHGLIRSILLSHNPENRRSFHV